MVGDAPLELVGRGLGLDHRELGHQLELVGRVGRELGACIVQRAAQGDGEVGIVERELLARAGREQHRHVDALEIHVLEPGHGVVHARPHARRRVELELVVGPHHPAGVALVDLHPPARDRARGPGEVLLEDADVLAHVRPEPIRDPPAPPDRLAAVAVGVDDTEPVPAHGIRLDMWLTLRQI